MKENIIIRKFFQDMTTFRYKLLVVCLVTSWPAKYKYRETSCNLLSFIATAGKVSDELDEKRKPRCDLMTSISLSVWRAEPRRTVI